MQVVPPTNNWEVQSIFLRGIDRYEGASKRLRRAYELARLGQDEETDAASDALFWGSEAAMCRAESYWESLTRAGGLLLGGWDSLAWEEACEVIGAKQMNRDQGGTAVKPTMAELRNAGVRLADALDKACAEFNNFSCGMCSAGFADGEIDESRFLLMQANAAYAIDLRITYDDQYDDQGGPA